MGREQEEQVRGGHVVVMPYPSQGHINPLLQFAKRLVSKGLKATIATTHYTVKSIYATNIGVEAISDGYDEGGFPLAPDTGTYLTAFKTCGSKTLSELIRKFETTASPVTCVIYDAFLPWALDVAKQHGICGASFFTNSATVTCLFHRIHKGLHTLPIKIEDTPLSIPGLHKLDYPDLPGFVKSPDSYPAYLAMKLSQFHNLHQADWIFGNTFDDLELQLPAAEGVCELWRGTLIGPMIPSAYLDGQIEGDRGYGASLWKPLDHKCKKWLEQKPAGSVAYVSFGSLVALTPKQMEEIAWGLKESGRHFLWVVKESEREKLPQGFIEATEEKGLVVTWCQQLELLAHKAIGCFVTHCGWNSTLEALCLGVPMVGVPKFADQYTNAKFIENVWGVGVRAKEEDDKGTVGREELQLRLREVMDGKRSQEMRRNADKWRELAKKAVSKGGSSDNNINEFVAQVCSDGKKRVEEEKHMNGF
ncbi:UDP-glycosyltransferase 74B1 [Macadamia integrifolia]|uniref:UDP-glycosyltransferase 74B1 n=1 Tax=Macadamia integrifolia TaxID=60698 RepID=UPI001C4E6807|nr:UDP-glycosyltransferase 74B1 [Macadamia integrifolia]XP_042501560.1 UDP-glycosyltransferase 74B1 [Macadamia integrifolia]